MKPTKILASLLSAQFAVVLAFGQSGDFLTSGKVVNRNGNPIVGATASYISIGKRLSWDFSDNQGHFGPKTSAVQPRQGELRLSLSGEAPATISFFTLTGECERELRVDHFDNKEFDLSSLSANLSKALYMVRIKSGASVQYVKLLNDGKGAKFLADAPRAAGKTALAKLPASAAIDTIRIGKTGYLPFTQVIGAYSTDIGTVTLDTNDIEASVTSLMSLMTDDEKRGQMCMPLSGIGATTGAAERIGSVFQGNGGFSSYNPTSLANLVDGFNNAMMTTPRKIPIMLAYDGVHGMCALAGGVILPHNLGMGAIQDSTVFEKAFRVAAIEMRGTGCTWTFAPCNAVVRDDHWGRSYEGFSETPDLSVKYTRWAVLGMQTSDLSHPASIAATAKHFAGDGGTTGGANGGNTVGTDSVLRNLFLPGYTSAVAVGVASIMPSFSSWNGTPMHANTELLRNWLKNGTNGGPKFDGFVVSDWEAANATANIDAGVDVPMHPVNDAADVKNEVGQTSWVTDGCRRVLRVKYRMNLMNSWLTDRRFTGVVGSQLHRDAVRAAVRNSLVLLKNTNSVLPVARNSNILIWGDAGNSVSLQCGGWSVVSGGTTILQGFQKYITTGGVVNYSAGGSLVGSPNVIIAVFGENPYTETTFSGINLTGDNATGSNAALISAIQTQHNAGKKIIVILMTGRILDVSQVIDNCDAFVWACWPGTEGDGFAEVMMRTSPEYNFYGRLPITFPMNASQEPINKGDGKVGRFSVGDGITLP
jgi:beta-glucosidase